MLHILRSHPVTSVIQASLLGAAISASSATHAYETDQLTLRDQPLQDASPAANGQMDAVIARALSRSDGARFCAASDNRLRQRVGRAVARQTTRPQIVWRRGFPRMFGHNASAAWLESAPIDRIPFDAREDIFGGLRVRGAVILALFGPSSTIRLGEVRLGTDKIDHFFSEGWQYWKRSKGGTVLSAGVRWGTRTENTYFGTLTSRAFSFADLRANLDGYRFYAGLLTPGSVVGRDEAGCPVQTRPWSWAEWVDWEYDEVDNPSVFAPVVQRGISRELDLRQEELCASWRTWHTSEDDVRLARSLSTTPDYVDGRAPSRVDPFRLAMRCDQ